MSENPELPINENSDSLLSGTSALPYLQFASILLKGLEKLAEIQKSTLDVYDRYTHQTQDAAESIKQIFPTVPAPLFEMAEEAIRAFLQLQVHILDLMLKQSMAQVEARANAALEYDRNIARLMRYSADCLLEMQEKAVEYIKQQNQSLAADQTGAVDGAPAVQPDTDAIVQAQKKFWDVTLKPFKAWQAEAAQFSQNLIAGYQ